LLRAVQIQPTATKTVQCFQLEYKTSNHSGKGSTVTQMAGLLIHPGVMQKDDDIYTVSHEKCTWAAAMNISPTVST